MFDLNKNEIAIFRKLADPAKIQDFLNSLPANFEEKGETYMSPRQVLINKRAHCMEGALLAAAILWYNGENPLLLDIKTSNDDLDHVVALYRNKGRWGAISKTNHAVLRYREPVYRDIRELAMSYFHEYFLDNGTKTMRGYSLPFDLRRKNYKGWITSEKSLFSLARDLDNSRHVSIVSEKTADKFRLADKIEIEAGKIVQYRR